MTQPAPERLNQPLDALRSAATAVRNRLQPVLEEWWANPLLVHQRRLKPFPPQALQIALPVLAAVPTVAAIIAWIVNWRLAGALLAGTSIGLVLIPLFAVGPSAAGYVVSQLGQPGRDPRQLVDIAPGEIAWGLVLVVLYRLRWLLVVALIFTPALIIGVLRLDISLFTAWHESAQVLGEATAAGRSAYLLPDGGVPYIRLVMHALSAGLLPIVLLPLFSAVGVYTALRLSDAALAPLTALLSSVIGALLIGGVWLVLALGPLLHGPFEVMRFLAHGAFLVGLSLLTRVVVRHTAYILSANHDANHAINR